MTAHFDPNFRFGVSFDPADGTYYRGNVIDIAGQDTGRDAFMASFPHLVDVGIMGHCNHGISGRCAQSGIGCYQSGAHRSQPNLSVADFTRIADECTGRVFQFALGGRGDPDEHEAFGDILAIARSRDIVPNYTTSGWGMTPERAALTARYCGAAAVSWQRAEHTLRAIRLLVDAGVTTNIHYLLSARSIHEARWRLRQRAFPPGINRVIFLLHKPIGQGDPADVLHPSDPRVADFFSLFNHEEYIDVAGFDSCSVPGLLRLAPNIDPASIETCEGGRFSAYIAPDMTMMPCSFDQDGRWAVDLEHYTMDEAWIGHRFGDFRERLRSACPECTLRPACLGGCPIDRNIVLCPSIQGGGTP